jgi:hypothetical protein
VTDVIETPRERAAMALWNLRQQQQTGAPGLSPWDEATEQDRADTRAMVDTVLTAHKLWPELPALG